MMELGGISWAFEAKYIGEEQMKKAAKDIHALQDATGSLAEAETKLAAATKEAEKAQKALDAAGHAKNYQVLQSAIQGVASAHAIWAKELDKVALASIRAEEALSRQFAAAQQLSRLGQVGGRANGTSGSLATSIMAQYGGQTYPTAPTPAPLYQGPGSPTNQGDVARYSVLASAADRAGISVRELTTKVKEDSAAQKEKGKTNTNLSQTFNQLSQNVQIASVAISTLAAALGAGRFTEFLTEATLLAARVENLGTVVNNVGSIAGYSRGQLKAFEDSVKRLGITTRQTREALAFLIQGEFDLSNAAKLARIAQDAAVIAQINSSEAFERLVIAIQRTNSWMLRNLGIMVNLNNIYRDFAISNGRVITTLSTHEKQQLLLNEVMRKGTLIQGTYEAALGDTYKQFTSLTRVFEEARVQLGEQFQPIFADLVQTSGYLAVSFGKLSDESKALIAALAAGAAVTLSMGAAVGILSIAVVAATAAFGTWIGALLLLGTVMTGGIAGAYLYSQALEAGVVRSIKRAGDAGAATASKVEDLSVAYKKLLGLSEEESKGPLSELQLQEVRNLLDEIIQLIPEFGAKLQQLDLKKPGEIARILKEISQDVALSADQRLDMLRATLEQVNKEIEDLRKQTKQPLTGRGAVGEELGLGPFFTNQREEAQAKLNEKLREQANLQGQIGEISVHSDALIARSFQARLKQQETAYNLALRIANQFNQKRIEAWASADVQIYQEYKKNLDNLSLLTISSGETIAGINAQAAIRAGELRAEAEKNTKAHPEDAAKIQEVLKGQLAALERSKADQTKEIEEQKKAILDTIKDVDNLADLEMEKIKKQTELQKASNDLITGGEDERIARLQMNLQKEQSLLKGTLKVMDELAAEANEEKKKLNEELAANTDPNNVPGIEANIERQDKLLERLAALRVVHEARAAQDIKEIEQELAAARKKIREDLEKDLADPEDKRLKLVQDLKDKEMDMERKRHEEALRLRKKELDIEKDNINEREKALKDLEKHAKDEFDRRVKRIEAEREFNKLIAQGMSPMAALGQVAEKFIKGPEDLAFEDGGPGRGRRAGLQQKQQEKLAKEADQRVKNEVDRLILRGMDPERAKQIAQNRFGGGGGGDLGQFANAIKNKLEEVDKDKKALEEKQKALRLDEEKAHEVRVVQEFEKAEKTREDILLELRKMNKEIDDAKKKKDEAAAREGGAVAAVPAMPEVGALAAEAVDADKNRKAKIAASIKSLQDEEAKNETAFNQAQLVGDQAGMDAAMKKSQELTALKRQKQEELGQGNAGLQGLEPAAGGLPGLGFPEPEIPQINFGAPRGGFGVGMPANLMQQVPDGAREAADAMGQQKDALDKLSSTIGAGFSQVAAGALAAADAANAATAALIQDGQDFEREFSAKGLA